MHRSGAGAEAAADRELSRGAGPAAGVADDPAWRREQVRLLYEMLPLSGGVSILVALLTATLLSASLGVSGFVWAGLVALMVAIRLAVRAAWRRVPHDADPGPWHRRFVAGIFLSGLVWGSAAWLLPSEAAAADWVVLAIVIAGMAAGAVPVLAPSMRATLAFVTPVVLPLAVRFVGSGTSHAASLSLLGLVYLGVVLEAGRRMRQTLLQNLHLRTELAGQAREATLQGEELKAVLAHSRQALALLGPDGRVLRWNAQGRALGGGKGFLWEALPWAEGDREAVTAAVTKAATGMRGRNEVAVQLGGWRRILDLAVTPVKGEDGAVRFLVAEAVDVSDMRRAGDEAEALNRLLAEALGENPEPEYLRRVLEILCQVPWLAVEHKAIAFVTDEDEEGMRLAAACGAAPQILQLCARVGIGECLCGRAAEQRRAVYAAHVDERHERRYEGMEPHGHYAVPMLAGSRLLGVLLFYLPDGHPHDDADEAFLQRAARAVALGIEQRRMLAALDASRQRLALHVERTPLAVIEWDTELRVREWNPAAERIFGYTAEEARGRSAFELIVPKSARAQVEEVWRALLQQRGGERSRTANVTRDGREILCEWFNTPLVDEDGTVLGVASLVMDVTEQVRMERALRESEYRFRNLVERSLAGVYIVRDGRFVYVNPRLAEIFGYEREEIIGREISDLVAPADREFVLRRVRERLEGRAETAHYGFRGLRKDGTEIRVEVLGTVVEMDGEQVLVGTLLDVTKQHRYEERIRRLANFDALTELPNRRMLRDRFREMLAAARRLGGHLAVLYLDLDRFKDVNDTLGHEAGDRLLIQVGQRLRRVVRDGDLLARLGGDEFAAVLWGATDKVAVDVARRIVRMLQTPFRIDGREVTIGASIGIARCPRDGEDVDTLLRRADIAMYRAKRDGRGGFVFYTEGEEEALARRLRLEEELRRAIRDDRLELHYQPRVQMEDRRIVSLEALVRWRHPERGLLSPSEFVAIAEEGGLIGELGRWVRETACRQLARWVAEGVAVPVAVNLSVKELREEGLPEAIAAALRRHGLEGGLLEVEITESAAMEDPEHSVAVLGAIKATGIAVSIDDFGTGYSSLSYLRRLPADYLKIDHSFVTALGTGAADEDIVRAIVGLARNLGLGVIAEGVETEVQERFLLAAGCSLAQGFRYSGPVPAVEVEGLLRRGRVP